MLILQIKVNQVRSDNSKTTPPPSFLTNCVFFYNCRSIRIIWRQSRANSTPSLVSMTKGLQSLSELDVKGHTWEQVASRRGFHKDLQLPGRKLLESVVCLWIVTHTKTGAAGDVHVINDIGRQSGGGSKRGLSHRFKSGSRRKVLAVALNLAGGLENTSVW